MLFRSRYTLLIGKAQGGDRHVRASVAYLPSPPPAVAVAADEKQEDKDKKLKEHAETIARLAKQVEEQNARLSRWTYLIPESSLATMLRNKADFLSTEKKEAKPSPAKPAPAPMAMTLPTMESAPSTPAEKPAAKSDAKKSKDKKTSSMTDEQIMQIVD